MNANLEEAANIATEYLSSLENLPNETQHILAEIKHRDTKTYELTEEIRKETQKYFRHSSKNPGQALSAKDTAIPETVNALYAQVDALAAEKVALAERLVRIFERAMARLQHDIQRILKLQGDDPGLPATQHFLSSVDSTVQQIQTGMRTAAAAIEAPAAASASLSAAGQPPQKSEPFAHSSFVRVLSVVLFVLIPSCIALACMHAAAETHATILQCWIHPLYPSLETPCFPVVTRFSSLPSAIPFLAVSR
ncbi:hypothetical protein BV20DRAFT_959986 [Pilatotrama ljubarskyi]|nr:hypothetical protein BV20DRAFT_959986 [Pilatotrama ljubarskyi]